MLANCLIQLTKVELEQKGLTSCELLQFACKLPLAVRKQSKAKRNPPTNKTSGRCQQTSTFGAARKTWKLFFVLLRFKQISASVGQHGKGLINFARSLASSWREQFLKDARFANTISGLSLTKVALCHSNDNWNFHIARSWKFGSASFGSLHIHLRPLYKLQQRGANKIQI